MSSVKSMLNRAIREMEKQQGKQCARLCFTIHLDDPDGSISTSVYRTRGYQQPNDSNHSQPINPQNEDTSNEPNA